MTYHQHLTHLIEQYGQTNNFIFEQMLEEFLNSIQNHITRNEAYNLLLTLNHDHLSEENEDDLSNIIADIRGDTSRIYYRFKDDPHLDHEEILVYVRMGEWRKKMA